METIIYTISFCLLIFGIIYLLIYKIYRTLNNTKVIDNFISSLTPDIKPSEIKSSAFKKYRYELICQLKNFRFSIIINILLLEILFVLITVISIYFTNKNNADNNIIIENKYNSNIKNLQYKIDSLNNNSDIIKFNYQNKIDSINFENKLIKEKLEQKDIENKNLNKYIFKLLN